MRSASKRTLCSCDVRGVQPVRSHVFFSPSAMNQTITYSVAICTQSREFSVIFV